MVAGEGMINSLAIIYLFRKMFEKNKMNYASFAK